MRAELRMPNYSLNSGTTSIKQYLVICHVCTGLNITLSRLFPERKEKKISKEQKSLSSFCYILSFLLQNIFSPKAFHEFYFKIFRGLEENT